MTYQTAWLESTGGCIGRLLTLGLHCAEKEANATTIQTENRVMLFPDVIVMCAINQKVLLILHNLHVTMLTNASIPWV